MRILEWSLVLLNLMKKIQSAIQTLSNLLIKGIATPIQPPDWLRGILIDS